MKQGEAFRSPAELLAHLLRDQAEVMAQIVRDATRRVNEVEDRLLANRIGSSRSQLGTLQRVLVRLQRLLAPELAALISEQNNRTLFLLTVVTVLALPFNVVGGSSA